MRTSTRQRRLCTFLLVGNLIFIWGNSLLPGEVSQAFSDWVWALVGMKSTAGAGYSEAGLDLVRKAGHFVEFSTLGMLLTWRTHLLGKKPRWALAPGVAAACIDETIQIFTPDRGPGLKDVALDSCGVAAGLCLVWAVYTLWSKKHNLEEN